MTSKAKIYQPEIKRLTRANSTIIQGRVVYIVKKNYEGKAYGAYIAYDYETKIQLDCKLTKEELISSLEEKDFDIIDDVEIIEEIEEKVEATKPQLYKQFLTKGD